MKDIVFSYEIKKNRGNILVSRFLVRFCTVAMESRGSTGEYFQQNSVKSPVQKEYLITRYPSVGTSSGKSSRDEIAPSQRRPLLHRRKCSYDCTTNRFQLYICRRAITNN